MIVAVIGAGYVGLVSAACLADCGHRVTCVDLDPDKIAKLKAGVMPILESGLDTLVARNVAEGRLDFATSVVEAVGRASVVIIAVATPAMRDGRADLTYIRQATRDIAPWLRGFTVVVTKSTVPVGTAEDVEALIRTLTKADVAVTSNPEFLREGAAIADFRAPDRIVVGVEDERARPVMSELYRSLIEGGAPMLFTDRRTAELTKYAANAFLAMKIAYINEVADLCEAVGADVQSVALGIGLDKRIGPDFLRPGPGFGGSCFPKDARALLRIAADAKSPLGLVKAAFRVNAARKAAMAAKIAGALGGDLTGKIVGVLGLTFKPDTDDMREAPSSEIVPLLRAGGATIQAFDPADHMARRLMPYIDFKNSAYQAAEDADALVLITEWDEFRSLDLTRIRRLMRNPLVVDLRNIYSPADMVSEGFDYVSIGRTERWRSAATMAAE